MIWVQFSVPVCKSYVSLKVIEQHTYLFFQNHIMYLTAVYWWFLSTHHHHHHPAQDKQFKERMIVHHVSPQAWIKYIIKLYAPLIFTFSSGFRLQYHLFNNRVYPIYHVITRKVYFNEISSFVQVICCYYKKCFF